MNALAIPGGAAAIMSSLEIAELTGKEHGHVMRDIRNMLEVLKKDASSFGGIYLDAYGREKPCLNLDPELTLTLVSGYDIPLRHRVVTRLAELEEQARNPIAALSRVDLLKLALESEEKNQQMQTQLAIVIPKAAVADRIACAEGSVSLREAANTLRVPERKFILWLQQHDWVYRRAGHKSLLAYADKVKAGLLYLKQTPITDVHTGDERLSEQVRVTPLGLTTLAKRLGDDGLMELAA